MVAGVVAVQVAQHDGAILPALEATTTIDLMSAHDSPQRRNDPRPIALLTEIADYVLETAPTSAEAAASRAIA